MSLLYSLTFLTALAKPIAVESVLAKAMESALARESLIVAIFKESSLIF